MIDNENENEDENTPTDTDLNDLSIDYILTETNEKPKTSKTKNKKPHDFDEDSEENSDNSTKSLEAVYDVPVQITAVLGSCTMPVHKLLKLGRGAVVELERRIGEAIDIYVNNRLIARGEVVIVGEHIGITMTEIIKSDRS
jgi:flagellar motor switch protein FliN/FliY